MTSGGKHYPRGNTLGTMRKNHSGRAPVCLSGLFTNFINSLLAVAPAFGQTHQSTDPGAGPVPCRLSHLSRERSVGGC